MIEDRGYLGLSEIGQCARRIYYTHAMPELGFQPTNAQVIQQIGHALEAFMRKHLRKEGVKITKAQLEVDLCEAKGHVDGLIKEGKLNWTLWECKSTTSSSIKKWIREGLPRYYLWQFNAYMLAVTRFGGDCEATLLTVVDRMSGRYQNMTVLANRQVQDLLPARISMLARAIENGPIPDREYEANSVECGWCPFRSTCYQGTDWENADKESVPDATSWNGFVDAAEMYEIGRKMKADGEDMVEEAKSLMTESLQEKHVTKASAGAFLASISHYSRVAIDTKRLQQEKPEVAKEYERETVVEKFDLRRVKA